MWNVLNLKVFITGIRPLAIINGKTAIESVGCPRFCPHSLFISTLQHELYDLHILPLTIRNQQSGSGWDLLFQAINIWSSHPIKYIPPAYCFPWILKYIPIERSGGWVWSLQLVKILPSKAVRHNVNYSSAEASPKPGSCASVLQSRLPWFLPGACKTVGTVLSPRPASVQGFREKVSRLHGLLPEGLVAGKGTEVSTLVSRTPPSWLFPRQECFSLAHLIL